MDDQQNLSGQDYAAHVQQNRDYYLKRFQVFSAGGFRLTWNWAAFLLPFAWPAYRRMYGWTIISPLLFVILFYMSLIGENEYPATAILLVSLFLPGLLLGPAGNHLYFLKMRSVVQRSSNAAASASRPDTTMNGAAVALILCWGAALVYLGVSIPGYVSYRVRAYDNRAIADLRTCRESFESSFADRQQYPATLEEARCAHDPLIVLGAPELTKEKYMITAHHKKGSKEYLMRSETPGMFARAKGSDQEWNKE